ncbi:MAG: 4Fe-4S binding protein [Fibrobacter sp.]|nr:4Fe-4S binding protein [Fibrobacter sp.]
MGCRLNYLKNVVSLKLNREKCTGCALCTDVCPRGVLHIQNHKVEIINRDRCIECGACSTNCAFNAISVKSGVGCAQAFINAIITGGEPECGCSKNGRSSSGCC